VNTSSKPAHRLSSMFEPRSVAIVGASDKSRWAQLSLRTLEAVGFQGDIYLVNRRSAEVFGRKTHESCAAIGSPVDLAILLIPAHAILDALDDLHAAGIHNAVVLAGGFAEVGHDGANTQNEIRRKCDRYGITIVGPNCLGFVNFAHHTAGFAGTLRLPVKPGSIAVVGQSGAVVGQCHHLACQMGIGLSAMVATGNEVNLGFEDVTDYLLDDPATKVVCIFAEASRDPNKFLEVAQKARRLGKPLVILKIGRSEQTARAAQAHTGALVGNDKVFDAICKQYGVQRVRSLDHLMVAAEAMARLPEVGGRRVAVLSISGGASEICADIVSEENIELTEFSKETQERLREVLPAMATVNNPLDLTGTATDDMELIRATIKTVAAAPEVDLVIYMFDVPRDELDAFAFSEPSLAAIGSAFGEIDKPALLLPYTMKPVGDWSAKLIAEHRLPYISGGMELGLPAIANALSFRLEVVKPVQYRAPSEPYEGEFPTTEHEAQQVLGSFGVPFLSSSLCRSGSEAAEAAARIGCRVAMKIVSPDIAHKSDVGGVRLNVEPQQAAATHDAIMEVVRAAVPGARLDGVLVSEMHKGGIEMLVSVTRDAQWGLILTIGMGGIFVEVLNDVVLRRLPLAKDDIIDMLGELRSARLLDGYRDLPKVDKAKLVDAVWAICEAALALEGRLETLEVNPLVVNQHGAVALDALLEAREPAKG
jgi:acetate---CoA ligase (ADP-forming)